ncbi:22708_t:CDS:2 [Dentiscutata erythropus]|uniref:22708_t:CDS:1 n=1 Tax=Dentiscutata erythropus TaxID=1348616 RepID=A0A9N9BTV6_9GLOM|nr:22708_t:CDS:2 [Dentiscutata erythropus]
MEAVEKKKGEPDTAYGLYARDVNSFTQIRQTFQNWIVMYGSLKRQVSSTDQSPKPATRAMFSTSLRLYSRIRRSFGVYNRSFGTQAMLTPAEPRIFGQPTPETHPHLMKPGECNRFIL